MDTVALFKFPAVAPRSPVDVETHPVISSASIAAGIISFFIWMGCWLFLIRPPRSRSVDERGSMEIGFSGKRAAMRAQTSPLFEIARVLVRFDALTANHKILLFYFVEPPLSVS
jgi:hypothetical protein